MKNSPEIASGILYEMPAWIPSVILLFKNISGGFQRILKISSSIWTEGFFERFSMEFFRNSSRNFFKNATEIPSQLFQRFLSWESFQGFLQKFQHFFQEIAPAFPLDTSLGILSETLAEIVSDIPPQIAFLKVLPVVIQKLLTELLKYSTKEFPKIIPERLSEEIA